jgi:hypothetical protein
LEANRAGRARTGFGEEHLSKLFEAAGGGFGLEEFFFAAQFGLGKPEFDALSLEVNALGLVLFALEASDIGGGLAEEPPLGGGVEVLGGEGADGGGSVAQGEPAGELVGEGTGEGFVAEGEGVLEVTGEGKGVEAGEPVAVAAGFPMGEVGRGDGLGVEVGGQDGLDLGEGVEPVEEGGAGLVVEEAAVELVTDGEREPGDLAGASNSIQIHSSVLAHCGEGTKCSIGSIGSIGYFCWLYGAA